TLTEGKALVQTPPQVLLLDADAENLEKLQTMLSRHGFSVLIAADGQAGLRLARSARPALVVLDLLLGGMDGAEVCRRLRRDEATRDIPILLLSALDLPDRNEPWRPTALSDWQFLRYDAFLPKPVELNQFIRLVERLVYTDRVEKAPAGPSVSLAIPAESTRRQLQETLLAADYKVRAFDEIKAAVQTFRTQPPTAVILDGNLIASKTWGALMEIRQRAPTMAIVVLLQADQPIPPESTAHIDGFIREPFRSDDLLITLAWTLKRRSLRQRIHELSSQVLVLHHELLEIQQTLRAQNEELSVVNAQLRQLDRLKQALTGMLVHDLKSPMAAVMGALHFLTMDTTNQISEISEQFLNAALAAGNQMVRLADTLLDEQQLEEGQLKLDTEPVDVTSLITASIEQVAALLMMNMLEIEEQIEEDLPLVLVDRVITQRVLENLLDNAIKYSPADETIRVCARREGDFVEICIIDRGPGIPPEQQEYIFKRFAQLTDQDMSAPRKGFGLGLAFCRLAVTAMGGKIWGGSPEDTGLIKGAAFHFTIPIYRHESGLQTKD
ncbi:MAG: ATP-binding protein, partial [Anaerolineae bacterium]